jgi:two-component system chemotaxis sensor kinase CheA
MQGTDTGRRESQTTRHAAPSVHAEVVSSPSEAFPTPIDRELLEDFIAECCEHAQHIEVALLALETDPEDREALDTTFRAFHTTKGTAPFLHFTPIADLAHHTESLLSRMRDGEIRCTGGYADLALRAADMLKEWVQALQNVLAGAALVPPAGFEELLHILAGPEAAGSISELEPVASTPPRLGDILVAEGKVERQDVETVAAGCGALPLGVALIRAGTASLPDVARALRAQRRLMSGKRTMASSVRVRTEHLDHLVEMIDALSMAHEMLAQDAAIMHSSTPALHAKVRQVSEIVCALRDLSTALRMVPLTTTFQKMLRVVHDAARKSGKHVAFCTAGEETEIDRHMVDSIADPLVHLVRNAVDHGLERPEVRERLGKPPTGLIQLRAYYSNGQVVIELEDDGQGLDDEKIVQKALARGLISSTRGLSETDIWQLIFVPAFSTADQVTDISGRGVGLDVVRKNIASLHGRIDVRSRRGRGTMFVLSLPTTRRAPVVQR